MFERIWRYTATMVAVGALAMIGAMNSRPSPELWGAAGEWAGAVVTLFAVLVAIEANRQSRKANEEALAAIEETRRLEKEAARETNDAAMHLALFGLQQETAEIIEVMADLDKWTLGPFRPGSFKQIARAYGRLPTAEMDRSVLSAHLLGKELVQLILRFRWRAAVARRDVTAMLELDEPPAGHLEAMPHQFVLEHGSRLLWLAQDIRERVNALVEAIYQRDKARGVPNADILLLL
jgi:hypothetical protein